MILAENSSGIQLLQYISKDNEGKLLNDTLISSAYAIIIFEGKVLLGYNTWRNQWELPAGKVEVNESPREAAFRELYEETHQKAESMEFEGLFKIYDQQKDEYRLRSIFLGTVSKIEPFKYAENDEMSNIYLWDMREDIGIIDEVDLKMLELLLNE